MSYYHSHSLPTTCHRVDTNPYLIHPRYVHLPTSLVASTSMHASPIILIPLPKRPSSCAIPALDSMPCHSLHSSIRRAIHTMVSSDVYPKRRRSRWTRRMLKCAILVNSTLPALPRRRDYIHYYNQPVIMTHYQILILYCRKDKQWEKIRAFWNHKDSEYDYAVSRMNKQ